MGGRRSLLPFLAEIENQVMTEKNRLFDHSNGSVPKVSHGAGGLTVSIGLEQLWRVSNKARIQYRITKNRCKIVGQISKWDKALAISPTTTLPLLPLPLRPHPAKGPAPASRAGCSSSSAGS